MKPIDKIIFLLLPIGAVFLSIKLALPYLISIFLFYGVPGIYLALRRGCLWQSAKAILFALITSIPFVIVVDTLGIWNKLWFTPATLFPSRIFNIIPLEDFFWMATAIYMIVVFYEVLFSNQKQELLNRRMWYFIVPALLVLVVFFLACLTSPLLLVWKGPYTYLVLGTIFFLLPTVLLLFRMPEVLRKSLPIVGYFFYLTLLFEITATLLKQWIFTGIYFLPPIYFMSNVPIPFEELFFVGLVGPLMAITFYRFFDNDRE